MTREANEEEIVEIVKLLKKEEVKRLKYKYDSEDRIGFVSGYIENIFLQYQDSQGTPLFASLLLGNESYEISEPKGELLELLKNITEKAKEDMMTGKTFLEKLKSLNRR